MPPVYSTPKNRRIDEKVLESLRQRNLLSNMQQRLDEMGIVQTGFKFPQQSRFSTQSQTGRAGGHALASQVDYYAGPAAQSRIDRRASRYASAGQAVRKGAQSADFGRTGADEVLNKQNEPRQANPGPKLPEKAQNVQSSSSSVESQRPEPQIIRPGDMRKSAQPVTRQRSQSSSVDSQDNALYLSYDNAQAEDISQVLMQQEEELEALRRRNADLIELLQQSKLLNDVETRNAAVQCDQIPAGMADNEDIYSIDPPTLNVASSVSGKAPAVQQRDSLQTRNPTFEEHNFKQQDQLKTDLPERAEARPQARPQLQDQSEKLQIQQAQILELSQQLNKQKEYENQLIEELMKMQRMAQNEDFKDSAVKMDTELLARNKQLEAQNKQLQMQLEQFNKKKSDQKYQKQREKYQQLKGKYVELQRQAQELNDILQNEQNETQVVIKELVQDIEEMKLRSEKKLQDD